MKSSPKGGITTCSFLFCFSVKIRRREKTKPLDYSKSKGTNIHEKSQKFGAFVLKSAKTVTITQCRSCHFRASKLKRNNSNWSQLFVKVEWKVEKVVVIGIELETFDANDRKNRFYFVSWNSWFTFMSLIGFAYSSASSIFRWRVWST